MNNYLGVRFVLFIRIYRSQCTLLENIAITGLFPFATASAAKEYCYDTRENYEHLFGHLEDLYGIQGKFATNFSGQSFSNWVNDNYYKVERDIDAVNLWPRICRRHEVFGISPTSEPNKPDK